MSESTSPQGAPSKSSRSRKSAVKKPRKSRSTVQEPAPPVQGEPTESTQLESTPAPPEPAPEVEVRVRSIRVYDKMSMIAKAAYFRAEQRRFAAGHELEDWLAAEAEIEALMRAERSRSS